MNELADAIGYGVIGGFIGIVMFYTISWMVRKIFEFWENKKP